MGKFTITLNGQNPSTIDCYSATPQRAFLTSWGGLNAATTNVLAVTPLGTHNPSSTGDSVGLDYVDIAGTLEPDAVAPVSTSDAGTGWYSPTKPISISATDETYVAQTRYSLNGGTVQTYAAPFTVSYDGTATILFASTDGAGNNETTQTAQIRCDATPPVTTSDAASSYIDSATVTFSATDNRSGVSKSQYRVDGGAWTDGTSVRITGYQLHTLGFRSIDVAGNVESEHSTSLLVRRALETYTYASPELSFKGSWTPYLDGVRTTTQSTGNYVTGYGRATRVKVYGYTGPAFGWARATIDGRSTLVNLYSTTAQGPKVVYDSASMADTNHSFKWAWTGNAGESGYTRVNVYSVEVEGVFGGEVDDLDPPVTTSNIPAEWVKPPFDVVLTQLDYLNHEGETYYGVTQEATLTATTLYGEPFTVSTDGTNTVSYYSEDTLGNTEPLVSQSLKLDSIPPTTTSDAVADYANTATIRLTAVDTMSGVATTYFRLDGGAWTAGTVASFSKATTALGSHTLQWYSVDSLGNTETVRSAQFTLLERFEDELQQYIEQEGDDWGRRVSSQHSGGLMRYAWGPGALAGTFRGDRFDLISAKDMHSGIARVVIDGVTRALVDQYSADSLYQQKVLSIAGLGSGQHVFRVEWTGLKNPLSLDNQINVDALELCGPIIGDQEPPISSASPTGQWRTTPETVQLYATDNGVVSPRVYYQLSVNGGPFSPTTDYDGPFEVSAEGTTTIQYWAVDGVGNVEVAKNAFVRIDRTAPAVSDDAPTAWLGAPRTVHIAASDDGCGLGSVLFSTDGGTPTTTYNPLTGIVVSAEGTTTIKYAATDLLGNSTGERIARVRLDFIAPSSSSDAPECVGQRTHRRSSERFRRPVRRLLDRVCRRRWRREPVLGHHHDSRRWRAHASFRRYRQRRKPRVQQDGHDSLRRDRTEHDRQRPCRMVRSAGDRHPQRHRCSHRHQRHLLPPRRRSDLPVRGPDLGGNRGCAHAPVLVGRLGRQYRAGQDGDHPRRLRPAGRIRRRP